MSPVQQLIRISSLKRSCSRHPPDPRPASNLRKSSAARTPPRRSPCFASGCMLGTGSCITGISKPHPALPAAPLYFFTLSLLHFFTFHPSILSVPIPGCAKWIDTAPFLWSNLHCSHILLQRLCAFPDMENEAHLCKCLFGRYMELARKPWYSEIGFNPRNTGQFLQATVIARKRSRIAQ
jgi:hypothetical protein